jgi:aromatic ring-opening dioxygenase catalytic subunit (LigB family)
MAELVGVFAASHAPLVARDWDILPAKVQDGLATAYTTLGRRVMAARPDVLIEISPDHWVNFFLNNLPTLCIGIGESHEGPPEPFLRNFPHKTLPGDAGLATHILETALREDFEPSISHHLTLDHGFCIPLLRMGLAPMPRIVPIVLNDLEPPMMSVRRCFAWGRLLAQAIASYEEPLRVAVLATGGLSHSIGEPTMGDIDEKFDHRCIELFAAGHEAPLVDFLEPALITTGNGGHEVRNWAVAHAAAGSRGFELVDYQPVPEVYVGCAWAEWKLASVSKEAT